jgi:hypothetical protein
VRKKITFKMEIEVDGDITVDAIRQRLKGAFPWNGTEDYQYEKSTLPDPETKRRGTIFWGTLWFKHGRIVKT